MSRGEKGTGGNNGFRDMIEVNKWVKNNIEYFEGDPNKITLFGESDMNYNFHCIFFSIII